MIEPKPPDLYCRILDLMIKIPSIMESLDRLAFSTHRATETTVLSRLLQICSGLHEQLTTWNKDLKKQVDGELYWIVPSLAHSPADDPIRGRIFPLAFNFPSLNIAQLLLLYWSTLIVLYQTIQGIQQRLIRCGKENTEMELNLRYEDTADRDERWLDHNCPSTSRVADLAKNICQSLEYCYRRKNGMLGLQSTVFPRWVAHEFYSSQPDCLRELIWCSEVGNMTAPDSRFDLHVMELTKDG